MEKFNNIHYFISTVFALVVSTTGLCQKTIELTKQNSDCKYAIEIPQDAFISVSAPNGYGDLMEIKAPEKDLYSFSKEHNSVWYKFDITKSGILSFELSPKSINDDYDFLLFIKKDSDFCSLVKSNKIKAIRTNIARNSKSIKSKTGLSEDATINYVHSGPGNSYSKSIIVNKGEQYYLLVDNVYNNGKGHIIKFSTKEIVSKAIIEKKEKIISINKSIKKDSLSVDTIFDNAKAGETISMDNVYFHGNSARFLTKSNPALENLYSFLSKTPNIHIEIRGHVNWPNKKITEKEELFNQKLSEGRAKAVCVYLINKGIKSERLNSKGMSYFEMLYPKPKTPEESQKNRRVEVFIVSD